MAVTISAAKKRGGCLTAFLAVMMIINPVSGLYYFIAGSSVSKAFPNMPGWVILLLGIIGLANLGFAVGIWKWQKWGIYGFSACAVITFIINFIYLGIMTALTGLVGVIILVALVYPLWKQME